MSQATTTHRIPEEIHVKVMFFIMGVSALLVLYLAALMTGLAPASTQEKNLIREVSQSQFASIPMVAAAVRVADESLYVSKNHYQRVADAIAAIQLKRGNE